MQELAEDISRVAFCIRVLQPAMMLTLLIDDDLLPAS